MRRRRQKRTPRSRPRRSRSKAAISLADYERALGRGGKRHRRSVREAARSFAKVKRPAKSAKIKARRAAPLISYVRSKGRWYKRTITKGESKVRRVSARAAREGVKRISENARWLEVAKAKDMTLSQVQEWRAREHRRIRREWKRRSPAYKKRHPLRQGLAYVDFLIRRLSGVY